MKLIELLQKIFNDIKSKIRFQKHLFAKKQDGLFVPPGHFYSPIPSIEDIKLHEEEIFCNFPKNIEGIDLNQEDQLHLLTKLLEHYKKLPDYKPERQEGLRYYYQNSEYKYSDAILLFCMMMHLKPQRIIEVGSGYSSCLMLDTNELFFLTTQLTRNLLILIHKDFCHISKIQTNKG